MREIIRSDNYDIYEMEDSKYKIEFKYNAYLLINSLVKSRLITGASTDENYQSIIFKANSVKSLKVYTKEYYEKRGKQGMLVSDAVKVLRTLVIQLSYLLDEEFSTIIGYNPDDIMVIDDKKFAFLGSELVANIDADSDNAMICCPFTPKDFFFSPEILEIKELPSYIHYKSSYFSLACLLIYLLLGNSDFYFEYLNHRKPLKILEEMNYHPVKNTKLYWLLSRCLDEDIKNRSILLI